MKLIKLGINPYLAEGREYYESIKIKRVMSKLKLKVFEQYHNKCKVCGDTLHNGERVELHHVKPVREGGKTVVKNLMPLH